MLTIYENIADVLAVLVVCITVLTVIAGKLDERRKTNTFSITWLIYEVGSLLIAGYCAWEMYPHLPLPDWLTKNVFVVLAMHGGVRFISFIQRMILKVNLPDEPKPK